MDVLQEVLEELDFYHRDQQHQGGFDSCDLAPCQAVMRRTGLRYLAVERDTVRLGRRAFAEPMRRTLYRS